MPDYSTTAHKKIDELIVGLDGFEDYVKDTLEPVFVELERQRQQAMRYFIFAVGGLVFIALGVAYLYPSGLKIFVFCGIGGGYLFYMPLVRLRERAKIRVMKGLCGHLGLDYRLKPGAVSLERHLGLSLLPSHNERKLEDEIRGDIEGVGFHLFEATLKQVSRGAKGRKRKETVFQGLVCDFNFYKNFSGTTIVAQDHNVFGNFFSQFDKTGQRVKLEDPVFEQYFEVHSTDQVEARYLLTPAFMERLLHLSHRVGRNNLQLAFQGGRLLMAIEKDENSFEGGSVFSSLVDPVRVRKIVTEVGLIYDIVGKLKLTLETKV